MEHPHRKYRIEIYAHADTMQQLEAMLAEVPLLLQRAADRYDGVTTHSAASGTLSASVGYNLVVDEEVNTGDYLEEARQFMDENKAYEL